MTETPDEKSTSIDEDVVSDPDSRETAPDAAKAPVETVETPEAPETPDAPETVADEALGAPNAPAPRAGVDWAGVALFLVLPLLALILAVAAASLKFVDNRVGDELAARQDTVRVAQDSTIALLSYQPDTVDQQLTEARNRLTGAFKDQYVDLTTNVVIPGAKQKRISAVATVPQAASVSASQDEAVVLVFVNQTVVVGGDTPTSTASSVRVTLDKVDGTWLISKFDPI